MTPQSTPRPFAPAWGDIVAVSFATTVAIWAVAYILRLPAISAPPPVLTGWIAVALLAGGYHIGRYSRRGWIGGLHVGLLSGLLNLLILGSAVGGDAPVGAMQSLPLFALASLVISVVLSIFGAAFGNTRRARQAEVPNWTGVLARVQVAAVFVLLIAGGLVTSYRAGLAVPDWPQSFGYNMFLLPLAYMDDAGVFLEHAHRLLGALVGLTSLAVAIFLSLTRLSIKAKALAWAIFAAVVVQGLLGGFRVSEQIVALAGIHGVLGQLIFGAVVALAVIVTDRWLGDVKYKYSDSALFDRPLTIALLAMLVAQVAVGAHMRHSHQADLLHLHITLGVFVLGLAIATAVRAWGLHSDVPLLRRAGGGLMHIVILQVVLGIVTLITGALGAQEPTFGQAMAATLHQANGALLLGWTVRLMLWNQRLLKPESAAGSGLRASA